VKGLALLNQLATNPAELLPPGGVFTDLPRLFETQQKVLGVEENFEDYALQAASALANGSEKPNQFLIESLFETISDEGLEIMRTASGTLPGSQGDIARALLQHAPK
jgi:hypothetical protein